MRLVKTVKTMLVAVTSIQVVVIFFYACLLGTSMGNNTPLVQNVDRFNCEVVNYIQTSVEYKDIVKLCREEQS